MARPRLDETEIAAGLTAHPSWEREGPCIARTVRGSSYREVQRWVNQIADAAEESNHHPDFDWRYTTLRISLTTHDSGGLTRADFLLAAKIDKLLGQAGP